MYFSGNRDLCCECIIFGTTCLQVESTFQWKLGRKKGRGHQNCLLQVDCILFICGPACGAQVDACMSNGRGDGKVSIWIWFIGVSQKSAASLNCVLTIDLFIFIFLRLRFNPMVKVWWVYNWASCVIMGWQDCERGCMDQWCALVGPTEPVSTCCLLVWEFFLITVGTDMRDYIGN